MKLNRSQLLIHTHRHLCYYTHTPSLYQEPHSVASLRASLIVWSPTSLAWLSRHFSHYSSLALQNYFCFQQKQNNHSSQRATGKVKEHFTIILEAPRSQRFRSSSSCSTSDVKMRRFLTNHLTLFSFNVRLWMNGALFGEKRQTSENKLCFHCG